MKYTLVLRATRNNKPLSFFLKLDEAIPLETKIFLANVGEITSIDNAFFCPKANELQYYLKLDSGVNHLSEITRETIKDFVSRNWTVENY